MPSQSSPAQICTASLSRAHAPIQHLASSLHLQPIIHGLSVYAMTDDQLIVSARLGDGHAFAELCSRHSTSVRKAIFRIVGNKEDAEDMLQDTLIRAFVHIGTFRQESRFSTWLTSIGVNRALMHLRKKQISKEVEYQTRDSDDGSLLPPQFVDPSPRPDQSFQCKQLEVLLRREVQRLEPSFRGIFEERYGRECSVEEVAARLSITVATAKSRLMRGRSVLRKRLSRIGIVNSGL